MERKHWYSGEKDMLRADAGCLFRYRYAEFHFEAVHGVNIAVYIGENDALISVKGCVEINDIG